MCHAKMVSVKALLVALWLSSVGGTVERIAPEVAPITSEELHPALYATDDFRSHAATIRRGLVCDQMTYRADSAAWFARHGTIEDVPYLIDALSDESYHVGRLYVVAGMATTRFWANVALIAICKTSYDFRWDAPKAERDEAIEGWKQYWYQIQRSQAAP